MADKIEGTIASIIYHNPENGFTVFSVEPDEECAEYEEVVCVATMTEVSEGELVSLLGSFIVHPSYGRQFSVTNYEKKVPTDIIGIERYLASGVIKGIGPRLAKKIANTFGEDTFHIMSDFPEKLAEIRGINLSKAITIGEIFKDQAEQRKIIIALQKYGISTVFADRIFKKYKNEALNIVKTNPYILADDISGIGFATADGIAFKIGIERFDPVRISCGIKYLLKEASGSGDVCLPKEILVKRSEETLGVESGQVLNALITLQMDRTVCIEEVNSVQMVYLNGFFYAESYVAKRLVELSEYSGANIGFVPEFIEQIERESGIILAERQRAAIKTAMSFGVMIITGGPGTGKTTIINTLIKIFEKEKLVFALCAPTGRAAKRITETTGVEAKTIHRLLEASISDEGTHVFNCNEDNPLEFDAIIVDESSMIDLILMYNFLKAVKGGTRLVIVGDADQLPSVGAGKVLRDMISSNVLKTEKLNEIYRQEKQSAIVLNAHKINNGKYPSLNDPNKDFFLDQKVFENIADTIVELVKNRLPKFLKINAKTDIQVLSPTKKSTIGTVHLNKLLQNALNPPSAGKAEKTHGSITFRVNDKVIQTKNNYKLEWKVFKNKKLEDEGQGVFNGEEGIITDIEQENESLTVRFDDDKTVSYDFSQLDELELSYAITVHKSQGCEYNTVVMPIGTSPFVLMNRNVLYTAITRAKKFVVLVGAESSLKKMIDNNSESSRFSTLAFRLCKIYEIIKN